MSWTTKRIDELGKVVTGTTPATANPSFYRGDFMFVTPTDLEYENYYVRDTYSTVTNEARDSFKNQFIPKNSIIFTCIGNTIGKCGISSDDCLTNQQINSIIVDGKNNPKFLYYLLIKNRFFIRSIGLSGGAAKPIINKSTFSSIKVRVPDKQTQDNIADILSAYDDLIENNRRRIQLLEQAARLLYKEWFVHLRFPGNQHTKVINGVPAGWERNTFSHWFSFHGGFAFKSKTYRLEGKFRIVTIKNVHNAQFIPECPSKLDYVPQKMKKHCALVTGDILLSLTGNVGRACIVFGKNYLLNQRVAKVVGNTGISPSFTYWTFSNEKTQKELENLAYGVAQLNLSTVKLCEHEF